MQACPLLQEGPLQLFNEEVLEGDSTSSLFPKRGRKGDLAHKLVQPENQNLGSAPSPCFRINVGTKR